MILGITAHGIFAFVQFMFVVVSGAAIVNGKKLKDWQSTAFDVSVFLLPGLTVATPLVLNYLRGTNSSWYSEWFRAFPLVTSLTYILFLAYIIRFTPDEFPSSGAGESVDRDSNSEEGEETDQPSGQL